MQPGKHRHQKSRGGAQLSALQAQIWQTGAERSLPPGHTHKTQELQRFHPTQEANAQLCPIQRKPLVESGGRCSPCTQPHACCLDQRTAAPFPSLSTAGI